jgi:hypothetical protein
MAQRHHHYELAFERFLRFHRVPYVAVNEARKTLIRHRDIPLDDSLKSFDFVLYGRPNLLAEIKGRRVPPSGRLDPWATRQDVEDLLEWETLFGDGFRACLVFAFWCDSTPRSGSPGSSLPNQAPPHIAFEDIFEHQQRWYALRAVAAADYAAHMRTRSERWDTVHIPTGIFAALSSDLLDLRPEAPSAHSRAPSHGEPPGHPRGTFLHRFGVPGVPQACA